MLNHHHLNNWTFEQLNNCSNVRYARFSNIIKMISFQNHNLLKRYTLNPTKILCIIFCSPFTRKINLLFHYTLIPTILLYIIFLCFSPFSPCFQSPVKFHKIYTLKLYNIYPYFNLHLKLKLIYIHNI